MQTTYTIMYNRNTNHLAGVAIRSAGDGSSPEDAYNACGALTRGRFASGKSFTDLTEAFEALELSTRATGRKTCKACLKAVHAQQMRDLEAAAAAAPTLVTVEIARHGQYQTTTEAIDTLLITYAGYDIPALHTEIKELIGDQYYEVSDLNTRFVCLMILAELRGFATN